MTIDSVHQRINELLDEKRMSIYKLADVCDLPHSSLYTMMSRHTMAKLDTLDIICKGLGITLCDFFCALEENKPDESMSEKEALLFEAVNAMPDRMVELVITYALGLKDAYDKEMELKKQSRLEAAKARKEKQKAKKREMELKKLENKGNE